MESTLPPKLAALYGEINLYEGPAVTFLLPVM